MSKSRFRLSINQYQIAVIIALIALIIAVIATLRLAYSLIVTAPTPAAGSPQEQTLNQALELLESQTQTD